MLTHRQRIDHSTWTRLRCAACRAGCSSICRMPRPASPSSRCDFLLNWEREREREIRQGAAECPSGSVCPFVLVQPSPDQQLLTQGNKLAPDVNLASIAARTEGKQ